MTKMTKDAYELFREEIRAAEIRRLQFKEDFQKAWNEYNRAETELQSMITLGDVEKAGPLREKVRGLRQVADDLRGQATAFSASEGDGVRELIASAPASKAHGLALEVVEIEIEAIQRHEARIEEMNVKLQKAKDQYLSVVTEIGDVFRQYYNAFSRGNYVEKYLQKSERKLQVPKYISPRTASFCLDESVIHAAYGNRPLK